MSCRLRFAALSIALSASTAAGSITLGGDPNSGGRTLTRKDALGDWTTDAPGVRRKVTLDDPARPYDTPSAENHQRSSVVPKGPGRKCQKASR